MNIKSCNAQLKVTSGCRLQLFKCLQQFIALIACLCSIHCCAQSANDTTKAKAKPVYGTASFYSRHLEGSETATGETFHHNQLVAASNHFKLNAWVRVTNLRNGNSVIVRINDRMSKGMQANGRIVDVTISAAAKLNFINRGLARVKVEEVPKGTLE